MPYVFSESLIHKERSDIISKSEQMRLTFAERVIIETVHLDITNDFFQKFLIEDLCRQHVISETKLTKGFKQLYGTTIYQYHLGKCMEHAKEEFKRGATVSELATIFNYSSPGSFSRAFRKIFPRPPSHYKYIR
jgi:AraC-like DNA-binding protein